MPALPPITLVLAGGNALGAYQAGVYAALHDHGLMPSRIVGVSAGAINGALIAGNAPADRIARLRALWRPREDGDWPMWWDALPDDWRRTGEALGTLITGRSGLFGAAGTSLGSPTGATPAIYATDPLARTLADLVDFDRLNGGDVRYAAVALDLDSGEDAVFDTAAMRVGADHVRASAAMPPNFPAVPIGERLFVDGGLSANLPLDPVLAEPDPAPTLCIAIDLLPAAAPRPRTLGEAIGRAQDLVFGCQSRRTIARWRDVYAARAEARSVTLVRLVYADQGREVAGKGMDFSPASVRARWDAGARDGEALARRLASGAIETGRPGLSIVD